tara:strand:+ start:2000 stop:2287 length:288 start_codon:yes stop_codon:yes gene_type:complete
MKIHQYSPGNGTLYQLGLESDGENMILVWLNPSVHNGGYCVNLGKHPYVNWDVLERQLGQQGLADVAAIQGWLQKTFSFNGHLPDGFDANGKYTG